LFYIKLGKKNQQSLHPSAHGVQINFADLTPYLTPMHVTNLISSALRTALVPRAGGEKRGVSSTPLPSAGPLRSGGAKDIYNPAVIRRKLIFQQG